MHLHNVAVHMPFFIIVDSKMRPGKMLVIHFKISVTSEGTEPNTRICTFNHLNPCTALGPRKYNKVSPLEIASFQSCLHNAVPTTLQSRFIHTPSNPPRSPSRSWLVVNKSPNLPYPSQKKIHLDTLH